MVKYYDSAQKIRNQLLLLTGKVQLSPKFFRSYECVDRCCACCPKFSLDYFPGGRWEKFKIRYPGKLKLFEKRTLNGVQIYSNFQVDNKFYFCRFLNLTTGKCTIQDYKPFSCKFEIIKVSKLKDGAILIKKKFSRGWNLKRLDGQRGARCKILPFNYLEFLEDINLLCELNEIGNQFRVKTKLISIINFLRKSKGKFIEGVLPQEPILF